MFRIEQRRNYNINSSITKSMRQVVSARGMRISRINIQLLVVVVESHFKHSTQPDRDKLE